MWQPTATGNESGSPANKQTWRLRMIGLTIALIVVAAYFGTVAWFGQGLAEDMRSRVRTLEPGSLVLDTEH